MDGSQITGPVIRYREVFPWLNLFRGFRMALDVRKLLLAGAALVLLAAGNRAMLWLPFAPAGAAFDPWPWQEEGSESRGQSPGPAEQPAPVSDVRLSIRDAGPSLSTLLRPAVSVLRSAGHLMDGRGGLADQGEAPSTAFAWTRLLWALAVWSLFGGAITRLAAVEFARDEKPSLSSATRYAGERFLSYLCAALLPAAFIGSMWLLCLVGGLFGRLPWLGELLVGALWIVPLVLGFFMALLIIGFVAGWPLMLSTISTEGTDAFDGFNRSFNYVYSRPWHAAWFAALAVAYGVVLLAFVTFVATLVAYLAGWGVSAGMGLDNLPPIGFDVRALLDPALLARDTAGWSGAGRPLASFWMHVVVLAVVAFGASYFWSAATIIYFLLRQSEDATDLDEVFLTTEPETDDLLPLVGVAASRQPPIERPPRPPAETPATVSLGETGESAARGGDERSSSIVDEEPRPAEPPRW